PLTAPAPAAIYTLSLHDALPISPPRRRVRRLGPRSSRRGVARWAPPTARGGGRQRAAPPRRTCPSAPPPSAQRTAPGSDTARGWVKGSHERGPHALGEDGHQRVELAAVGGEELVVQVLEDGPG